MEESTRLTLSQISKDKSFMKRQCVARCDSKRYLVFECEDASVEVLDGWDARAS